jgi:nitrate/nitrite transport system permease protein
MNQESHMNTIVLSARSGSFEGPAVAEGAPEHKPAVRTQSPAERQRAKNRQIALRIVAPLLGFALLLLVWELAAEHSAQFPSPLVTWHSAQKVFAHPFYDNGPNDVGIGWNLLASLQRVAYGFGLAALVGIPLGFAIGRMRFLDRMLSPIISLLRPVSPLA